MPESPFQHGVEVIEILTRTIPPRTIRWTVAEVHEDGAFRLAGDRALFRPYRAHLGPWLATLNRRSKKNGPRTLRLADDAAEVKDNAARLATIRRSHA